MATKTKATTETTAKPAETQATNNKTENKTEASAKPAETEKPATPAGKKKVIKFNANGGSGDMPQVEVDVAKEYQIPECKFTAPEGKQFKHWAEAANGKGTTHIVGKKLTQLTEAELTLYAVWVKIPVKTEAETKKTKTIHFMSNGGSGHMASVEAPLGQPYSLPECTFKAPRLKSFKSWGKGSDGTSLYSKDEQLSFGNNVDMFVYAIWEETPYTKDVRKVLYPFCVTTPEVGIQTLAKDDEVDVGRFDVDLVKMLESDKFIGAKATAKAK